MKSNSLLHRAGPTGVSTLPSRRAVLCGLALLLIGLAGATQSARASDPVGVYAFVDKIVFEPEGAEPQRVQIWGGFAKAKAGGNTYESAQRGFLYFTLTPGKEKECRNEWNDLKSVAGKPQIVGFGMRHRQNFKIRAANAKVEAADPYPMGMGVMKMTNDDTSKRALDYQPIKELRTLRDQKSASANSKGSKS